jgi:formylmethanofuran dehydrogenase subunit C
MFSRFTLKSVLLILGLLMVPVFGYFMWSSSDTLDIALSQYGGAGGGVRQDFEALPTLPLTEEKDAFTLTDNTSDGIDIQFVNQSDAPALGTETPKLNLSFPKDYSKPIEIKLDDKRTVSITDLSGKSDYSVETLGKEMLWTQPENASFFQKLFPKKDKTPRTYLRYQSDDDRKSLLYAYQKDQAAGEKKLKHWTLYERGDGIEQESYRIEQAKVKVNSEGVVEVYYYIEQDLKNDQAAAEVDTNLMARAQRTLAKEMGDDLLSGSHTPDFTIPKPYYIDVQGEKHEAQWKWSEENATLSVSFSPTSYPVALDPTLSFTAPGSTTSGSVITGEGGIGSGLGTSMVSGDFNADGKTDLAVGASTYGLNYEGRVYIFYNDSSYAQIASGADVVIHDSTGYTRFGTAVAAGDVNGDGRTDLIASTDLYDNTSTGAVKIFYNDGSYPSNTAGADVSITGEANTNFGSALKTGDFNTDGKADIVVGAPRYSSVTGRAYIFYNDGSIPTTAGTADVFINGNATNDSFGSSFAAGDVNSDGKTDLIVGAYTYSSSTGRAYIFYNDGSIPTTAGSADVTITGENASDTFGAALTTGDFDADGKVDLASSSPVYSSYAGRVYIFYGDGSIPTTAATADVKITTSYSLDEFGRSLGAGDMNNDGRTDLVASAGSYFNSTGRTYIFYNDGSIPTATASADVTITGEGGTYFGSSLATGDFNVDGKTDVAVGANLAAGNVGRVYIFYSQNGQVNTNQSILGVATSDQFGIALTTGDFNADGRTDLAVGADGYSSSTGRAYIFYGDGQIPTTAATADVTITGNATGDKFGASLVSGDLNADGKTDLAIGGWGYSSTTGRVYIFYNDGSIPTTAGTADVTITGASTSDAFGVVLVVGDLNASGTLDLVVGSSAYSYNTTGNAYIFYNDGSIPTTAGTADVTITGETSNNFFSNALATGDFNADGKADLVVGAWGYSSSTGRAYIFYNDGSIPTTAGTADVILTGEATDSEFSVSLASGDFNADGKIDIAVGGRRYSTYTGRVYFFYNDGLYPAGASTSDLSITGEATNDSFAFSLASGDFNADGRTDLAVGAYAYTTNTGRVYTFYNDGSIPTTAATADVKMTGETTSNYFGASLVTGDMNGDGRGDLIVGAYGVTSNTGKVYFYETRENFAWQIQRQPTSSSITRTGLGTTGQEININGEGFFSAIGWALATGDFNADGRMDLVASGTGYASSTGRVYIFFSSGSLTTAAASADVIIGGSVTNEQFGGALASGDFNADGRIDLAVSSYEYSNKTGRAYLFYNDGSWPANAASADVTLTGESTLYYFGWSMAAGDFNADGETDLAVGSYKYSSDDGRVYIFYNDGSYPAPASADVIITGEASSRLGTSLVAGDFNADGRTDLASGAQAYTSSTGRVYIFYNDGSIPTTAATADVIITGGATSNQFGDKLVAGDYNTDGTTDLAVSATTYSSSTGRVYIFNNDGSIPTTAATADVTITGETTSDGFGSALVGGDWNADGRIDLAVGASGYSSATGRSYIFHNDGSIPTTAATADIILTGESAPSSYGYSLASGDFNVDGKTDLLVAGIDYSSIGRLYIYTFNDPVITGGATSDQFGYSLASADFNADGRTDLAVGAYSANSISGRTYLFYNDGVLPNAVASADVTITGSDTFSEFGKKLTVGDWNGDGRTDLAVSAPAYDFFGATGRVYLFYNDGTYPTTSSGADVIITGEATSNQFGIGLTSGDFNYNGQTDLVVSASSYSSSTGRVYVFYGDGSIPTTAGTADVTITGEATSNLFGYALTEGDFNTDGKIDLAVGAVGYNPGGAASTGRAYVFYGGSITTENASGADVIITGAATSDNFGTALSAGDLNTDGKSDLVVSANSYSSSTGRVYVFYGDGSIPTTAGTADVTITGEATNDIFGNSLATADWNTDGRTDLAVGARGYSSFMGRVYTFNNDGSYPTSAGTADVIVTGIASSNNFGRALTAGDWNSDGQADLAVGADGYSSSRGQVYIFTSEVAWTTNLPGTFSMKGGGTLKGTGKLK